MPPSVPPFPEADRLGKGTVQWGVGVDQCPLLKPRRILSLGHCRAGPGYRVARERPAFGNLNLTLAGQGQAFIGDRWEPLEEGMAVLSPPGIPHASRSLSSGSWEFCWICFAEPAGTAPRPNVAAPTLIRLDPKPLGWALLGLEREFRDRCQAAVLDALLGLIDLHLDRALSPARIDDRLWKLWEAVSRDPAREWTAERMAATCHLSSRELLRRCRKDLGRSLREQLIHIRLTKAASLLQMGGGKLQAVAEAVGYGDAFAFSKAFKKWAGVTPADYRARLR